MRHHLSPAATGAVVSLMAASTMVVQPWAGRRHDHDRLPTAAPTAALLTAAAGFAVAAAFPDLAGLVAAALLVGAGVAVVTPVGFSQLAASAPAGRLGRTMGAARSAASWATLAARS